MMSEEDLMTLSRTDVVPGLLAELQAFAELIDPLEAADWARATRCEGWAVGDVAAHVVGSIADVVSGQLDGLGSPEVTAREVDERKGRSPAELAQELVAVTKLAADLAAVFDDASWEAPGPGGYEGTLGQGVEALWYDTYLHADDVRAGAGPALVARTGPAGQCPPRGLRARQARVGAGSSGLRRDRGSTRRHGRGDPHRRRPRIRVGGNGSRRSRCARARRSDQHLRVMHQRRR